MEFIIVYLQYDTHYKRVRLLNLIAHQEVARKKIITMKEDLDNLEKEVPIYTQILKEGNIAP